MRTAIAIGCLALFSLTAFSQQNRRGTIFGLISDQGAHLVWNAPIDLRNIATGARFHVETGDHGEYRLSGLPVGDYDLSIAINGIGNLVQRRIMVTESALRLDIILPLG
jgi:hypothetical protein